MARATPTGQPCHSAEPEPASGLSPSGECQAQSAQPTAREQMRSVKDRLRAEAVAFIAQAKKPKDISLFILASQFGVRFSDGELMITRERLSRGEITLADLPPPVRRALIDPAKLDIHALAAGPIMDSNQIYLPAGKCSLEEVRAREALSVELLPEERDHHGG